MTIQVFYYSYGASHEYNRRINFTNSKDKIIAIVEALQDGEWIKTSQLTDSAIEVDVLSSTEKMKQLIDGRKTGVAPTFEVKNLSDFPLVERIQWIQSLAPMGKNRVEIENGFSPIAGLESVTKITIFDPT